MQLQRESLYYSNIQKNHEYILLKPVVYWLYLLFNIGNNIYFMEIIMIKIKMVYHDLNVLGGNRNLGVNYDDIVDSVPEELGDMDTLANSNNDVRSLRVSGGVLRIDELIETDRYLKFHFVKLRDGDNTKSLDNAPGVDRLELPVHEFVSKHSVVIIDKLNDKVIFQKNRNVVSEKTFCEFMNFFWRRAGHNTTISMAEIPDNPAEFARALHGRLARPKAIEVTSRAFNRIQDEFNENDAINESIRTLGDLGGYTVKLTLTKSHGGEEYYLDNEETNRFVQNTLENGAGNFSKANVVYYDEDEERVSVLDLIGNKKKSEVEVETNEYGDFDWTIVSARFIEQYNVDFQEDER